MKKLITILLFVFVTQLSYSQTTFTQTFVDRCTNEVSVVTAIFVNGSATVAFYNKVRTFTYQQFVNGELQTWLNETYVWWSTLSPCSQQTNQQQQAQQAAAAAAAAAQAASEAEAAAQAAASAAAAAAEAEAAAAAAADAAAAASSSSTSSTSSTSSGSTDSGSTSSGSTSSGSTDSGSTDSGSTDSGSTDSGSTEGSTDSGSTEGSTEGSSEGSSESESSGESESEGESESGSESEETTEEVKEEEKEEKKEEKEEKKEEKSEEEKKKEEEEKKKKRKLNPIQLNADAMGTQNPVGGYDTAISIGASQSSIFGDVSYSANLMLYSNLNQASLALGRTKLYMDDKYKVSWIESMGVSYSNNYGSQSVAVSFMRLKPMGTKGTIGVGLNYSTSFGTLIENPMISFGYNFLYANSFKLTDRITYSPAFILAHTPITYATKVDSSSATNDIMFILANSFSYRITKTFTINFGYTGIKSTNPNIPLINAFMVGSKLPF